MRAGSSELAGVLTGSFDHYWTADVYYDGERRLADVPITDVKFSEDGGASIQQTGGCTVLWTDEFASSLSPIQVTDMIAPFGAQLAVYSIITAGPFTERVPYGWFEITEVPSAVDETMLFRGTLITVGSTVELELKELLAGVGEESFDVPSAPSQLLSVWAEAGIITGLQLLRSVTDAPITRTILYPDSRLDALYDLLALLDAVPHMTADGTLAARPNVWPAPVGALTSGDAGSIVDVGNALSAAQVYNRVVVRATSGEQKSVLAVAEVREGPLRVRNSDGSRSPFRARTRYLSSEYVTTQAQAQDWADRTLAQTATRQAVTLPVTETFNPLRERGDVVTIQRPTGVLTGRIITIDRSDRVTQKLTVEVNR